ncbi:MAG TPA: SfiI family type II restriction endonuclease [Acidobacteriaceae bacterium]
MRLVVQALYDFRETAAEIFQNETDKAADKGEDATRDALDTLGVSKVPVRLFGKIDYKRARFIFHPEYALRQALFVDSKAEKQGLDIRLQIAQTSLRIWHDRSDGSGTIDEQGTLPRVLIANGQELLTTTIFVKYVYRDLQDSRHQLLQIKVAALPNGFLQNRYNPSPQIHLWKVGPNSPQNDEDFRARMSFSRLAMRCPWRQQIIPMVPELFTWENGGYVTPPSQPIVAAAEEAALEQMESAEEGS